jgi:type IV secretory pathway VirB10-like protein
MQTETEARLAAKAEEGRVRKAAEAKKLKQADVGSGYQISPQGDLVPTTDNSDLPTNKALAEVGGGALDEIRTGLGPRRVRGENNFAYAPEPDPSYTQEADTTVATDDEPPRQELEKSMLGYSTIKAATWALRKPEQRESGEKTADGQASKAEPIDRLVGVMEQTMRQAAGQQGAPRAGSAPQSAGNDIRTGAGPAANGSDLLPAEEAPQPFAPGGVGDMRIGGDIGAAGVVRQGKFLDCALVNDVRADLVDSPVIAMVSRDFVSLDGTFVLVPAGSKLIGTAGRVQNLQQSRVYIRVDRIIFPDQRSAYFPVRKLPAVDGAGVVGIDGDVDRHFMLTFGSAVVLGMLDGLAAAVEGQQGATPTTREMLMARTSMNMSQVVAGILQRYGNVVPTISVEAGAKMKVFFAEDVRMSPYMRTRELSWVKGRR